MTEAAHLNWLMNWYAAQCDGDWEHEFGIEIGTLDNPGWSLKIDLSGTGLEGVAFSAVEHNLSAPDGDPASHWHSCRLRDGRFEASGGARDLDILAGVFRKWAEANGA